MTLVKLLMEGVLTPTAWKRQAPMDEKFSGGVFSCPPALCHHGA
jgi:hypothetical protein